MFITIFCNYYYIIPDFGRFSGQRPELLRYKSSYIFINQNIKKSSRAYTYEDFWLENSSVQNVSKMRFSKEIPHVIHMRIFDWKIHQYKMSQKWGFQKKSLHAYTYNDFWPLENSSLRMFQKWGFQKKPPHAYTYEDFWPLENSTLRNI